MACAPILRTLPHGKRIIIAGAKSGNVFGLDLGRKGALVWKVQLAMTPPGIDGLLKWGGAADEENAYLAVESGDISHFGLEPESVYGPLTWILRQF
jgi:polyvinyl alcohol dehydrogenase (cytochrome)